MIKGACTLIKPGFTLVYVPVVRKEVRRVGDRIYFHTTTVWGPRHEKQKQNIELDRPVASKFFTTEYVPRYCLQHRYQFDFFSMNVDKLFPVLYEGSEHVKPIDLGPIPTRIIPVIENRSPRRSEVERVRLC